MQLFQLTMLTGGSDCQLHIVLCV